MIDLTLDALFVYVEAVCARMRFEEAPCRNKASAVFGGIAP